LGMVVMRCFGQCSLVDYRENSPSSNGSAL
jgi:hypothetical protein